MKRWKQTIQTRLRPDPPYASDLYQPVLSAIAHYQAALSYRRTNGEHRSVVQPQLFPSLEICMRKGYITLL